MNPQDVENAAWHFLCLARAPKGSVETARKSLIAVTNDTRVPMAQIQQLFAGNKTPEDVLRAGEEAGGTAKFYADLYVGLYYEARGQADDSLRLIARAADNPAARKGYMGDVARVHVLLRKKAVPSNPGPGRKSCRVRTMNLVQRNPAEKPRILAGHSRTCRTECTACAFFAD